MGYTTAPPYEVMAVANKIFTAYQASVIPRRTTFPETDWVQRGNVLQANIQLYLELLRDENALTGILNVLDITIELLGVECIIG